MPPKIPISTHRIMGITFTPANPLVDVMRYISHGGKPPLHTLFFLQTSQADGNVVQSKDVNL